jgi:hypothetical protein
MSDNAEHSSGLAMKAVAVLALLVCAWILLKVIIGVVTTVAWIAVIGLALFGIFWAYRTLTS